MKECCRCKTNKPRTDFRVAKHRLDGLHPWCKSCDRSYRRDYMKNYRRSEYMKEYMKEYSTRIETRVVRLYKQARERAEYKGHEFNLTKECVLEKLVKGVCERTGQRFDLSKSEKFHFNPLAPSIDKIDPSKPYSDDNIQMVTDWYNRAKGQHSDAEFVEFCKMVVSTAERSWS